MKRFVSFVVLIVLFLNGCAKSSDVDLGSFTMEKSYSYDEKYYVRQTTFKSDDDIVIALDIHRAADDAIVYSVLVGLQEEYQGYCWEKDSYRLWIQKVSGVVSYVMSDFEREWLQDDAAILPEYIITITE